MLSTIVYVSHFFKNLLDSHNPHGISRTTLRPPPSNDNNEVSTVQQTFALSTGNSEIDPLLDIFSPWFSFFLVLKEARNDVSVNVALSNGLVVSGNSENRAHWSVFGHEVRGFSGSGQANDGFGGAFYGGFDAGDRDCFTSSRVNKSIDSSALRFDKHNPKFENFLKTYQPNGLEVTQRHYRKEDFEKFSVSEWRSLSFGYKVQF